MRRHDASRKTRPAGRGKLLALAAAMLLLVAACGSDVENADVPADFETADQAGSDGGAEAPNTTVSAAEGNRSLVADAAEEESVDDTDADVDESDDEPADDEAPADDGDGSGSLGSGGTQGDLTAEDLGRKLIFTAEVTVGVDDVEASSAEASDIIDEIGGFLFGQETVGGAEAVSILTFKVLPEDFNRALEALGTVGELRSQVVQTSDVTERVVDLQSRIEVMELGIERLRANLENTTDFENYARVEQLLLEREEELALLRGQLRSLEDQIDLATITLTLTRERVENTVSLTVNYYEGHDDGRACPGQGGFRVEEGTDVTICFEVFNAGDQTLTDIQLTDSALEIEADTELITVFGEADELAPGQSVLLAFETKIERTTRLRTRVTAIPTDGVSSEQAGPSVTVQIPNQIDTVASTDGPGFGDGFGAGVSILKAIWTFILIVVGLIIPLLLLSPLIIGAWLGLKALRRRRPPKRQDQPPPQYGGPPPPNQGNPPPPHGGRWSQTGATPEPGPQPSGRTATAVADGPESGPTTQAGGDKPDGDEPSEI